MALTLPDTFKINSVSLIDNYAYQSTTSRSLKPLSRPDGGQRFEFTISSTEMEQKAVKALMAFMAKVNRTNDKIQVYLPVWCDSDATTKTTVAELLKGESTVELNNVTDIAIGDLFTISGLTKAYTVDGLIGDNISFSPAFINDSATLGSTLTFDGCELTMTQRPGSRVRSYDMDANRNSAFLELDLVEAL